MRLLLVGLIGTVIMLEAACSPAFQFPGSETLTPIAVLPDTPVPATPVTPSPLSPPTEEASTDTSGPCGYVWATQPLPEITDMLQQALQATGLKDISGRAEAYGENCMDAKTGKPRSFSTMETDFRVSLTVEDLTDKQALGQAVEKILVVLDRFFLGQVPGPQPGYIGINFTSSSDRLNLWFRRTDGETARQQGLKGSDLLDALLKK
jgi:hypothetical protein